MGNEIGSSGIVILTNILHTRYSRRTLEAEQLCDWTHMASAFFLRAQQGLYAYVCIFTTSRNFNQRTFLQQEEFRSKWTKKVCVHQIQFCFDKK